MDAFRFLLAWLGSVAIQAGTNLTNVYFNYKATSASADPRSFDPRSSTGVLRMGLLSPAQVRRAGLLLFGGGILCGLILTWLCGPTILWLGLPAIAAGYFYAGPPIRYGYIALGVVSVFIFMGPVMVCGAYFVQTLHFSLSSLPPAISIGLVAAGIMHVNDLRDYDTDVLHGKQTLATLLGRRRAGLALAAIDILAFGAIVGAAAARLLPWPSLLVLIAIPQAAAQLRLVLGHPEPAQLHMAWLNGVKLHMQFGIFLILGFLASAALHY